MDRISWHIIDWSGRREDSCGKSVSGGDPAGAQRRGGSPTARGKRSAWSGNKQSSLTAPTKKSLVQAMCHSKA
ncbi:hypothetical protein AA0X95_08085 [Bacillus sp. 1P10SD]|uniref:hypothetical protein n=1 Tax=Bacillus sp. 1P10SD TaxID=3132265 RepID=UPI0039A51BAA